MVLQPFAPKAAGTVSRACTGTTARVQVDAGTTVKAQHWRIYNAGPNTAFVEFGGSGIEAAAATGMPIPAGAIEIFSPNQQGYIAGICASGETATLYITPGAGG